MGSCTCLKPKAPTSAKRSGNGCGFLTAGALAGRDGLGDGLRVHALLAVFTDLDMIKLPMQLKKAHRKLTRSGVPVLIARKRPHHPLRENHLAREAGWRSVSSLLMLGTV